MYYIKKDNPEYATLLNQVPDETDIIFTLIPIEH